MQGLFFKSVLSAQNTSILTEVDLFQGRVAF